MDEEAEQADEVVDIVQENLEQEQEIQAEVVVDIPQLNPPMENFLHEIQVDELMDEEDLQNEALQNQVQQDETQNLIIGRVQLTNENSFDPGLASWMKKKQTQAFSDPSGCWSKFFAPYVGCPPACLVPAPWANFFTAILLSPKMFDNAKEILKTAPLMAALEEQGTVGFHLPPACPVKSPVECIDEDECSVMTGLGLESGLVNTCTHNDDSAVKIGLNLELDLNATDDTDPSDGLGNASNHAVVSDPSDSTNMIPVKKRGLVRPK